MHIREGEHAPGAQQPRVVSEDAADDEVLLLRRIWRYLEQNGFFQLHTTRDAREANEPILRKHEPPTETLKGGQGP